MRPDIEVVGEAADGLQARDLLARTPTDVVLRHIRMPRLDGSAVAADVLLGEPTRRLVQTSIPPPSGPSPLPAQLSARNAKCSSWRRTGHETEVAARLHLGGTTVETYVSRLLVELGRRDRVGLVIAACEHGVVAREP